MPRKKTTPPAPAAPVRTFSLSGSLEDAAFPPLPPQGTGEDALPEPPAQAEDDKIPPMPPVDDLADATFVKHEKIVTIHVHGGTVHVHT